MNIIDRIFYLCNLIAYFAVIVLYAALNVSGWIWYPVYFLGAIPSFGIAYWQTTGSIYKAYWNHYISQRVS